MNIQSGMNIEGSANDLLDPDLDVRISALRKAELELEEILQDPGLERARTEIASMNLQDRKKTTSDASLFIKTALSEKADFTKASAETREIKIEISKSDINDLSAEWVREWHRKKQSIAAPSPAELERKNFVSAALSEEKVIQNSDNHRGLIHRLPVERKSNSKILRYTSLAAAAVIGLFLAISTLIPSAGSEKLLTDYYVPYNGVSTIARGSGNNLNDIFNSAVIDYNNGNFTMAETGFNQVLSEQASNIPALFYLGLTQLETGKMQDCINNLNSVVEASALYSKEALWYLGFAYLKNSEEDKAAECFGKLSSSKGYYSERAARILKRLK